MAEGFVGDVGDLRARFAHELHRRKIRNSTADELRAYWASPLAPEEKYALDNLRISPAATIKAADVPAIVTWTDEHVFARKSVVNDYDLMAAALARGRGETFELADLLPSLEDPRYL